MSLFTDRHHAGRVLAAALGKYSGQSDVLVLGLPRGGVPVAYEVAHQLAMPLDVLIVRKLGVAGHEELAMGALASGGFYVLNQDVVDAFGISKEEILRSARAEQQELSRRQDAYRGDRAPVDVSARTVLLVDDGLATGSTMRAAIQALRPQHPKHIVAAAPVADADVCAQVAEEADEMVCATMPQRLDAIGIWYDDFSPTSDDEVRGLLEAASREQDERARSSTSARA